MTSISIFSTVECWILLYFVPFYLFHSLVFISRMLNKAKFHFSFQMFFLSTPTCSSLHIPATSTRAQKLEKTSRIPQTTSIFPVAKKYPSFPCSYHLALLLLVLVLRILETLPPFAQNLKTFPKMSFSIFPSQFLCLFYRLKLAPSMYKKTTTLSVTTILM